MPRFQPRHGARSTPAHQPLSWWTMMLAHQPLSWWAMTPAHQPLSWWAMTPAHQPLSWWAMTPAHDAGPPAPVLVGHDKLSLPALSVSLTPGRETKTGRVGHGHPTWHRPAPGLPQQAGFGQTKLVTSSQHVDHKLQPSTNGHTQTDKCFNQKKLLGWDLNLYNFL